MKRFFLSFGLVGAFASAFATGCPCGQDHQNWLDILPPEIRTIAHDVEKDFSAERERLEQDAPPEVAPPVTGPAGEPVLVIDERRQRVLNSDIEMGKEIAARIEQQGLFSKNQEMIDRVNRIGNELAQVANSMQAVVTWGDKGPAVFPYQFKVLAYEDVNAFSVPGGFIYVYEGLIEFCETDDELAGVLGHEIAHAAFRHVATLQARATPLNLLPILAILLGGDNPGTAEAITGLQLLTTALANGWSVEAEKAADFGGFQYLQKTNYSPVGLLTFMERLAFRERVAPEISLGMFRTHPPTPDRVNFFVKELQTSGVPIRRSMTSRSLRVMMETLDDGGLALNFNTVRLHTFYGTEALTRSDQAIARLNAFFDSEPALFDLEVSPDGIVMGRGRPLFTVQSDDLNGRPSLNQMIDEVRENLRKAVYDLNFRVRPDRTRRAS